MSRLCIEKGIYSTASHSVTNENSFGKNETIIFVTETVFSVSAWCNDHQQEFCIYWI